MGKNNLSIRQKVEALVKDQTITDYRIAKDTGIHFSAVHNLRSGKAKVGNIRLAQAEKYADFYDQLKG